jgi:hypothetical protein
MAYVLSFHPTSTSWDAIYELKKFGGLSLIGDQTIHFDRLILLHKKKNKKK